MKKGVDFCNYMLYYKQAVAEQAIGNELSDKTVKKK